MNLYNVFYKQYYLDGGFERSIDDRGNERMSVNNNGKTHIATINNTLCNATLTEGIRAKQSNSIVDPDHCFTLEVAYPGLITGIGINHEVGGVDSEFKLGLHFDYTTGMPVIYGSTVKGAIRSYFKHYDDNVNVANIDLLDLEKEVFEGLRRKDDGGSGIAKEQRIYEPMSIYDRDIFFDAVIVQGTNNNKFLVGDTICPHDENPLKNPKPISFLKIAPGVKIEFRFKLKDGLIPSTQKIALFKDILQDWGVGAKTNVGYGQFL